MKEETMGDLTALEEKIALSHGNIRELYAQFEGKPPLELYRCGFGPGDALNVMSVTKSVVALLVGIAIDRGFLKSEEEKVLACFPSYTPKRGEKTAQQVTLRHVLTMTAPYKYRSEPWTKVCTSGDWAKAALDLLGGKGGITGEFKYATLGVQILNGAVESRSGLKAVDFANRFLFAPLGIAPRRPTADQSKEGQFAYLMSKEPKEALWYAGPGGAVTAGWGLALSVRDMAKIGFLCLNGGLYEGKRVVSEQWIKKCVTPVSQCTEAFGNMAYGYLWWIVNEKKGIYAAIGDGGNVIYVDPNKRAVAAVAATFKPRVFDRVSFIEEQVLPLL